MKKRRYYLGRIAKAGVLDNAGILQALNSASSIEERGYLWSFSNVEHYAGEVKDEFMYGLLTKSRPHGVVQVVEDQRIHEEPVDASLVIAASPFVYIPAYSAIAYQHIWNQIERTTFVRKFCALVEKALDNFFVGCSIDPITDLRSFVAQLQAIERITSISAKVHPPNPLFGKAWSNLRDYLRQRQTSELAISEKAKQEGALATDVVTLIANMLNNPEGEEFATDKPIALGDAAILMAADGYGRGKVAGVDQGKVTTIRTGEVQKNILFDATPDPQAFAERVVRELREMNSERNLGH